MQRTKGWVNITINIQTYVPVKTHLVFSLQGQRKWTCASCVSVCLWLTRLTNLIGKREEENKIYRAKKPYQHMPRAVVLLGDFTGTPDWQLRFERCKNTGLNGQLCYQVSLTSTKMLSLERSSFSSRVPCLQH